MRNKQLQRLISSFVVALVAAVIANHSVPSQATETQIAPSAQPNAVVYPGVKEFRWTYYVAEMRVEEREYVVNAPTVTTHPARWDYDGLGTRTERRKIGSYPEFSCKYFDFTLSNECHTVWHNVYADLPVFVVRPRHVDFDVPAIRIQTQLFPAAVPRWTWKQVTLTITLPAVALDEAPGPRWSRGGDTATMAATMAPTWPVQTDSAKEEESAAFVARQVAQAETTLSEQRQAMTNAVDDGVRALDAAIAAAQAAGADPGHLIAGGDAPTDLYAARVALLEEKTREQARLDQIAAELKAVSATAPVAGPRATR